ncbi:MAG: hypothetical protein ABSF82_09080 [Candidatus Bathyarchaeia archaeon]|jgi:hypothetical protein
MFSIFQLPFSFSEIAIFAVLLIVGIIIILLLKAVIHFILPIIAAVVVWFLTHSLIYAGIAFVVIAIIQMIIRRR